MILVAARGRACTKRDPTLPGHQVLNHPMNGHHPKETCSAHNRQGNRCGRMPIVGGNVCKLHGGGAPQVKQKAMERILAFADPAAAILIDLAQSGESEQVRLAAARDLLDRAGFGAKQKVEQSGPDGGPIEVTDIPAGDVASVLRILHGGSDAPTEEATG